MHHSIDAKKKKTYFSTVIDSDMHHVYGIWFIHVGNRVYFFLIMQ